MRKFVSITLLGLLAGCGGGHSLDSPVNTCKSVTQALAGNQAVVWHGEQQSEQKGSHLQVTLDFALGGQAAGEVSQAVCIYGLSSQDMDYRNAMGEYTNTPTRMLINGRAIPEMDLVQAVNLATGRAANEVGQQAVESGQQMLQKGQEALQRLNQK